ncbi:hypothetical protein ACFVT2_13800 [Streptomyces sp. NPDC058000]|uniref:hypothetical protein n=1 Tax=Streptomyces sp. NPDC058000 TaxID=3346299 RepID=UPI0036F186B9
MPATALTTALDDFEVPAHARGGEHTAVVEPDADGDDTSMISVVHRSFTNRDGDTEVDLTVGGDPSAARLCSLATQLGTSADAQLGQQ